MAATTESATTCITRATSDKKKLQTRDLKAYLLSLPPSVLNKLYSHPATCFAVFRQLPRICQLWVMRMLFLDRPVPQTSISSWITANQQKEMQEEVSVLSELHLWKESYLAGGITACQLTQTFRANLTVALVGGGEAWMSEDSEQVLGKHVRDRSYLTQYGDSRWSTILHYMVGSAGAATTDTVTPGDLQGTLVESINVLKYANLIDSSSGDVQLTSAGFQFLLLDTPHQVWFFLLQYLDTVESKGLELVECLNFIFQLSFSTSGKSYSTDGMSDSLQTFLQHLREFGLVYQRKRASGRFYTTHLSQMVSAAISGQVYIDASDTAVDPGASQSQASLLSSTTSKTSGYLVLETNYRLYAYTDSDLQVAILSLFSEIKLRFPNVVVAVISRESVREALKAGITALQIIQYLKQHVHPQMLNQNPVLPSDVVDQIRLWELEMGRFTFQEGVLYNQFLSQTDFEMLRDYAKDLNVLLHEVSSRRMMIVTPAGHEEVRRFWKRQRKSN